MADESRTDVDENQLCAESSGEIYRASRGLDCLLGVCLLEKLPRGNPPSLVSVIRADVLFESQLPAQLLKALDTLPELGRDCSTPEMLAQDGAHVVASRHRAEASDDRFRRVLYRELRIVYAGTPA
jgi:hypothetical protein